MATIGQAQHSRGHEEAVHESRLLQRTTDRASSAQPDAGGRHFSRNQRSFCHVKLKVFDISKGMAELYGGFFVSDRKKGICIGTTERTAVELEAFLRAQQRLFTPDKYDMFKHNCNHFSDLVLRFLNHRLRVPSYIASLPERILQTTLGKLVYPLVNAAMDRTKNDICQHADKAELCGEIFFYGGAEPLLVPGERSTHLLMKRMVEEFKQQQLEAVAHRTSTTASKRSKSTYRRDRPGERTVYLDSGNSSGQRTAAVSAFYSDAVLARCKHRGQRANANEALASMPQQSHREQRSQQHQQQQQQHRHPLQIQVERGFETAQSGKAASSGLETPLQGRSAATEDVGVPTRISETASAAPRETSFVYNKPPYSEKGRQCLPAEGAGILSAAQKEVNEHRRRPESWLMSRPVSVRQRRPQSLRRNRSLHAVASHRGASGGENIADDGEEKQQIGFCSSRSSDRGGRKLRSFKCQWKSHADFLHSAGDAHSSSAEAASADAKHGTQQYTARRLQGISSGESSGSSDCSRQGNHRIPAMLSSECHIARRAGALPYEKSAWLSRWGSGHVPAEDKWGTPAFIPLGSSLTNPQSLRLRHGGDADTYLRVHMPAKGSDGCRHPVATSHFQTAPNTITTSPSSPLSISSTTVGSRISTRSSRRKTSSSSCSRNSAHPRRFDSEWNSFTSAAKKTDKSPKTSRNSVPLPAEDTKAAEDHTASLSLLPLQRLRQASSQTHEDARVAVQGAATCRKFSPSATARAAATESHSASSDRSGSMSTEAAVSRNCETEWVRAHVSQHSDNRQGSDTSSRRTNSRGRPHQQSVEPTYYRPPLSPLLCWSDVAHREETRKADAVEKKQVSQDWGVFSSRRRMVTSQKLLPAEGDTKEEDAHRSRRSSQSSRVSDTSDDLMTHEAEYFEEPQCPHASAETQLQREEPTSHTEATRSHTIARNREIQDCLFDNPRSRRTSCAAGNSGSDLSLLSSSSSSSSSSPVRHGVSAACYDRQREPRFQMSGHSGAANMSREKSGSCSCIVPTDRVRRDCMSGGDWMFSATNDRSTSNLVVEDLSGPCSSSCQQNYVRSPESPLWPDGVRKLPRGHESGEATTETRISDPLQLPAHPGGSPTHSLPATGGTAEDGDGGYERQVTPADCSYSLNVSTSTALPTANSAFFEDPSDCYFLESAHEDDQEGGEEEHFSETKNERPSSGGENDEETEDEMLRDGVSGERGLGKKILHCETSKAVPTTLCPRRLVTSSVIVPCELGEREGTARFWASSPRTKPCKLGGEGVPIKSSGREAAQPEDTSWQSVLLETDREADKEDCRRCYGEALGGVIHAAPPGRVGVSAVAPYDSRGSTAGSSSNSRLARESCRAPASAASKGSKSLHF